jgi:UDP-N-acetylmuramoylalanine--D-glutamate ligase
MINNFKGKKVLVMGLGLQGGALSVVKWLLKNKAIITITDIKTRQQLKPTLDKIKKLPGAKNIKYTLNKHDLADFDDQDLVVQNPGVPKESKYLAKARRLGIPIVNEAVMFFGLYKGKIIGVTGTRGKSTTTTLLHKILKTRIKHNQLAGNIAINPMLSALDKLKINSWPVVELSSWHLENLAEYKKSPHIAVITNVMMDHLNRYKDFNEYKQAKIFNIQNQKSSDYAVLNADNKYTKNFAKYTKAQVYYFSLTKKVKGCYLKNNFIYFNNNKILNTDKIKLLGQHNLSNILAAVTVAKIIGVSNTNIAKAINNFKGVDYRLQYIGKYKHAKIYNDSTSTTPDAGKAALLAVSAKTILITGGVDKGLDYSQMAKAIKQKASLVIILSGSVGKKLLPELKKLKYTNIISNINSLSKAWQLAKKNLSDKEKSILFSPAGASFNMFTNEFDRARQFDKLVNGTQKKK